LPSRFFAWIFCRLMTPFLIFASLLVLVVLALLVPPLWRGRQGSSDGAQRKESNLAIFRSQLAELEREKAEGELDEKDFAQAREELQRRLLDEVADDQAAKPAARTLPSRKTAIILTIVLPLLASAGYLTLGNFRALDPLAVAQQAKMTPEQIVAMVDKLAQRLQDNPGDAEGWMMLGRSYKMLNRPAEAAQAYAKIEAALGDDPDFLTDYADLLAMLSGGDLRGKPLALINKALHIDPNHVLALWLAGTAAFDSRDFAGAVVLWERARNILPPDSEDAAMLNDSIATAKNRMDVKSDLGKAISGTVELAKSIAAQTAPSDTVFIFARPTDGTRTPLAVAKLHVADLPYTFTLDDSSAIMGDKKISGQTQVIVEVRTSQTGNAIAQDGDLQSKPVTVRVGEKKLKLVIDQIVKRP